MNRAPKIGERVRYREVCFKGEPYEETREVTGTVVRIYKKHDDVFDDDGEFVRAGPLLPPVKWKAAVKVDARPKWWPYPNTDMFAPDVACLEPIED